MNLEEHKKHSAWGISCYRKTMNVRVFVLKVFCSCYTTVIWHLNYFYPFLVTFNVCKTRRNAPSLQKKKSLSPVLYIFSQAKLQAKVMSSHWQTPSHPNVFGVGGVGVGSVWWIKSRSLSHFHAVYCYTCCSCTGSVPARRGHAQRLHVVNWQFGSGSSWSGLHFQELHKHLRERLHKTHRRTWQCACVINGWKLSC